MKLPNILLTSAVCCLCVCFFGCTAQDPNSSTASRLNEWQMNLLEAEGLPTEYDQLTVKQQNTIDRVWKMISYLNKKYDEEFVYVDYIPPELNQSETLTAYPRSTGSGNGKYLVTVKTTRGGFKDNYFDFSVEDLAEDLTNEFLTEHFGDSYKYFVSPLACDVKMSEMEDGKFQWKYGAENQIFLLEELCSVDNLEEFAVEYAQFLYDHELLGWCKITGEIFDKYIPNPDNEYGFGGTNIYRQATDRDLEIIGAEAPIHIWSATYFRAFVKRDGKHGCDELSLKKVVYDLETALEVERGVQKQPVQNAFTMSRKTMTQNAGQLRRDPVQHEKPEKHRGNEIS